MISGQSVAGSAEWEEVGAQLLRLAERDAWRGREHSAEYCSAFVAAAVEVLLRHPGTIAAARSPWGLVVIKARQAGLRAVGAEATCGLTDRDPVTHHVRLARAPRVVSWDALVERDDAWAC